MTAGCEGAKRCTVRSSSSCGSIGNMTACRFASSFAYSEWAGRLVCRDSGREHVLVFDHYPAVGVLYILRSTRADIADEVVDQGAEDLDKRQRARRADD